MRWRGRDLLRPTPRGTADPLATACFPLIPYANRIAHGRFTFDGRSHALPPNFGTELHSIHGVGWRRNWDTVAVRDAAAILRLIHHGDLDWPWPFTATQTLRLTDAGATATLALRNDAGVPMPAGIGFHPYFLLPPGTHLRFGASRLWRTDATLLPTSPAQPDHFGDWRSGSPLGSTPLIDNAFEHWDGRLRLRRPDLQIEMTATNAAVLHLYAPPGAGFCCLEPVNHLPDALNRPDFTMPMLEPGATAHLVMTLATTLAEHHDW